MAKATFRYSIIKDHTHHCITILQYYSTLSGPSTIHFYSIRSISLSDNSTVQTYLYIALLCLPVQCLVYIRCVQSCVQVTRSAPQSRFEVFKSTHTVGITAINVEQIHLLKISITHSRSHLYSKPAACYELGMQHLICGQNIIKWSVRLLQTHTKHS